MALFTGTSAANTIVGTASADTMRGYGGNDILDGRGGSDHIYGGAGDDRLTGGKGNDVLSGGGGKDLFLFAAGDGQDRITDLALGDVVSITGYGAAQSVKQVGSDANPSPRHHLDLYASDQAAEVQRLIGLGAREVDWDYEDGADYVVLADPDGNRFCVVDAGEKAL